MLGTLLCALILIVAAVAVGRVTMLALGWRRRVSYRPRFEEAGGGFHAHDVEA